MLEFELEMDMDELSSAEDFLEYFCIDYEQNVVNINRLHILQRFHDYLSKVDNLPEDENLLYDINKKFLQNAYEDFVGSDALTEKVFKVFHMHEPQRTFVPLSDIKIQG
ncbi:Nitrogenase stabilizing/protective protein NifW [hydrothermal vent metagenome]|uniref:Nitrogenase stabilizing/protective protein NifW n=1 Tax=hydrothermal vent metagenome TaxID=652676 RepID=A0A3B1BDI3_9ZZZZ